MNVIGLLPHGAQGSQTEPGVARQIPEKGGHLGGGRKALGLRGLCVMVQWAAQVSAPLNNPGCSLVH